MSALAGPEASAPTEAAVLDVGSNSVRLVAFRVDGGALVPFLNEKVMAGLGRNLRATGRLSPEGVAKAKAALLRFRALLDALDTPRIEAVATAAVREAADGEDFVRWARDTAKLPLRVIAGEEEARLSALGVLAGAADPDGIVGDLGGSSLELVGLSQNGPQAGETFPLGPLALMDGDFSLEAITALVDAELARSRTLANQPGGAFIAVGGAWRALARIDMRLRNHPLAVLQGYEIGRADALKTLEFVARQSRKALEKLGDAAEKRAETLPYAAVVLERVLRAGGFDRVVVSSYGLREGLIFAGEPQEEGAAPLLASAAAFGAAGPRSRRFGAALARWLEPAFTALPPVFPERRDGLLRAAAAHLADVGAMLHPDQRADLPYALVLRAPLAGLTHPERAFLAAAVRHRYTRQPPAEDLSYQKLLNDAQRRRAAALGAAMRLAADLSGRSDKLLASFRLTLEAGTLSLAAPVRPELLTESAAKRLEPLAALLDASVAP